VLLAASFSRFRNLLKLWKEVINPNPTVSNGSESLINLALEQREKLE
jgi:hypothetical protein